MTALDFLKSKGLIKDGFTELTIWGEFGQIELTKLLEEYNDVSQQRELLVDFLAKMEEKAKEYKHLVPSENFIDEYLNEQPK